MFTTASHGNKFPSNSHTTSLITILVLSLYPFLYFPDGLMSFPNQNLVWISHFSRSISIVAGYGLGYRRSISSRDIIFFRPFHQCVLTSSGTHSASDTQHARFTPGSKQKRCEFDHSSPSIPRLRRRSFIPPYLYMAWCLNNYIFYHFGLTSARYLRYLTRGLLTLKKSMINLRKLNQQLQDIVTFLQWAKYLYTCMLSA